MKFSIAKFVVLALIAVVVIVALHKYTSEKIGAGEGDSLSAALTAGLSDEEQPAAEAEEEWDKPYSKNLVKLIEGAEAKKEMTEEELQKMAGVKAEEIYNEEFSTKPKDFPFVRKIALESRTKYSIAFETDKPIRFVVYAESPYNYWKEKGSHGMSKVTTNSVDGCCKTAGSYNIDVNEAEGGDYYFLFDGSDAEFETGLPTQVNLKVTKTGGI